MAAAVPQVDTEEAVVGPQVDHQLALMAQEALEVHQDGGKLRQSGLHDHHQTLNQPLLKTIIKQIFYAQSRFC